MTHGKSDRTKSPTSSSGKALAWAVSGEEVHPQSELGLWRVTTNELPAVVGPREKVIVQPPPALTPPAPMMLEAIESGPSVTTWPGPVFAAIVSLVSLRPIEAPDARIPCPAARTIKSLSSVTG